MNKTDFAIREAIGKTYDIEESKCSHAYILKHELPDDENRCRQCGILLETGIGRWNDYLVIRHPKCDRPICMECAEKRPDIFHIKFRDALKKLKKDGLK
jgi:ferredoxin